jgi:hypothetical protein
VGVGPTKRKTSVPVAAPVVKFQLGAPDPREGFPP